MIHSGVEAPVGKNGDHPVEAGIQKRPQSGSNRRLTGNPIEDKRWEKETRSGNAFMKMELGSDLLKAIGCLTGF